MRGKKSKIRRPDPASYRERSYRRQEGGGELLSFTVQVRETDLQILAPLPLAAEATELVLQYRAQVEGYLRRTPDFLRSLLPLPLDPLAPPVVKKMLAAGHIAGVGPMAAVAGAMAEAVGQQLLAQYGLAEIVVENGGDIFLRRREDCLVGIFAGQSALSQRVAIRIKAEHMPLGICTSSATVGPSLSLGQADAVTVLAADTALADAAATCLGNATHSGRDLQRVLALAQTIPGLLGVVVIIDNRLGAWGEIELVATA